MSAYIYYQQPDVVICKMHHLLVDIYEWVFIQWPRCDTSLIYIFNVYLINLIFKYHFQSIVTFNMMLSCFHINTDSGQWEIDTHGFLVVDSKYIFLFTYLFILFDIVEALHPYACVAMQLFSVIKAPGVTSPVPLRFGLFYWGKFLAECFS